MTALKDWKVYVLGVVAAGVVTVAGNWSSSRIDVLETRAHALEADTTAQDNALKTMIATLARLEQKIDDLTSRTLRIEQKVDSPPARRK